MVDLRQMDINLLAAGARLLGPHLPAGSSSPSNMVEWIEHLVASTELDQSMPIIEHLFGVIPTLNIFEGTASSAASLDLIRQGKTPACLGLFTPTPEFSWSAAAVPAVPRGNGLALTGEVRITGALPEWTVVLARTGEQHRLALVSHGWKGVTRTSRRAASSASPSGGWLSFKEAVVEAGFLSAPVSIQPGEGYWRILDDYAAAYAFAAALYAQRGIQAMRRALRKTSHDGHPFNISQLLAMSTTELEVQIQLVESTVRAHFETEPGHPARSRGLALAASASRLLSQVVTNTHELRGKAGVPCPGPFSELSSSSLVDVMLGGQLLIESELARALGI